MHRRYLLDQRMQAADLRRGHGEIRRGNHCRHLHEELDHVDDEHTPQACKRRKAHVQHANEQQRLPASQAEQDAGDLARRQVHRGHDHAIEKEPEINRAESANRRRRRTRIPQLVEFEIGEHARAPPQSCVEKHRRDAGQHERPPHPIPGHAVAPDDVGDEVGSVGAERGGDHGEARQPPGHRASGGEELGGAAPGAFTKEQRRPEADQEGASNNQPVERRQVHLDVRVDSDYRFCIRTILTHPLAVGPCT